MLMDANEIKRQLVAMGQRLTFAYNRSNVLITQNRRIPVSDEQGMRAYIKERNRRAYVIGKRELGPDDYKAVGKGDVIVYKETTAETVIQTVERPPKKRYRDGLSKGRRNCRWV